MSFKFRLISEPSDAAADDARHAAALSRFAEDTADEADDLTSGLPPELAALAAQLIGESDRLEAAFPAPEPATPEPDTAEILASKPAEPAQRWNRFAAWRRRGGAAAAVLLAAGLWALLGAPGNRPNQVEPAPAAAKVMEPAATQSPTVHAVIFSELSGAEQEGLLDLLTESGSVGSI
jgi:hypothetical protein